MCEEEAECKRGEFKCGDGKCVSEHLYCEHCEVSSDKKNCSKNKDIKVNVSHAADEVITDACLSWPPVCSQTCISTATGYKCDCLEGYVKVEEYSY